jgi:hypothetical protein
MDNDSRKKSHRCYPKPASTNIKSVPSTLDKASPSRIMSTKIPLMTSTYGANPHFEMAPQDHLDYSNHHREDTAPSSNDNQSGTKYKENTIYIPGFVNNCCQKKDPAGDICQQCLKKLLDHHSCICDNIRSGKCFRQWHKDYKEGRQKRQSLDHQTFTLNVFNEEQHEIVKQKLIELYCKKGDNNHINHCLQVL